MSVEKVDTLVVGAGQAGVAMSEHLSKCGMPHLVLERHRIAERWRTGRWDSLVANGPAWHDRFPGMEFPDDPDAFVAKEKVADYFVAYAERSPPRPLRRRGDGRCERNDGRPGFRVETSDGVIEARYVVAATGPFQRPVIPERSFPRTRASRRCIPPPTAIPASCPRGRCWWSARASSGAQIADELLRAGRRVYLSVGPHDRPPRALSRARLLWWLGVLDKWDAEAPAPARSTSPSRSAAPMAARPSTSGVSPRGA